MAPEEDEVALIVEGHYLSTLQLRIGRVEGAEEMGGEEAQGCSEVVENEFWYMAGRSAMSWDGFAFIPVCDGEVEGRANGQMNNDDA